MTDYRYHVGNGLRLKNHRLGEFSGPELCSEEFDSLQDYCMAVATELLQILEFDEEYHDNTGEEDDGTN